MLAAQHYLYDFSTSLWVENTDLMFRNLILNPSVSLQEKLKPFWLQLNAMKDKKAWLDEITTGMESKAQSEQNSFENLAVMISQLHVATDTFNIYALKRKIRDFKERTGVDVPYAYYDMDNAFNSHKTVDFPHFSIKSRLTEPLLDEAGFLFGVEPNWMRGKKGGGNFHAYDSKTGDPLWSTGLISSLDQAELHYTFDKDHLYAFCGNAIIELNKANGDALRAKYFEGRLVYDMEIAKDGTLFVALLDGLDRHNYQDDVTLLGLDSISFDKLFETRIAYRTGFCVYSKADLRSHNFFTSNQHLYNQDFMIVHTDGTTLTINQELSADTAGYAINSFCSHDDFLYYGLENEDKNDCKIIKFNTQTSATEWVYTCRTEKEKWNHEYVHEMTYSPTHNQLYLQTHSNKLVALCGGNDLEEANRKLWESSLKGESWSDDIHQILLVEETKLLYGLSDLGVLYTFNAQTGEKTLIARKFSSHSKLIGVSKEGQPYIKS